LLILAENIGVLHGNPYQRRVGRRGCALGAVQHVDDLEKRWRIFAPLGLRDDVVREGNTPDHGVRRIANNGSRLKDGSDVIARIVARSADSFSGVLDGHRRTISVEPEGFGEIAGEFRIRNGVDIGRGIVWAAGPGAFVVEEEKQLRLAARGYL